MNRTLIIFGEYTADEARSAAQRQAQQGRNVPWGQIEKYFFDFTQPEAATHWAQARHPGAFYHIAIADNQLRSQAVMAAEAAGLEPITIIDPSSFIDPSAIVETGCFIAANSVVSANAHLGRHCLIHFNATIGHHSRVGEFNSVLPGARLSGFVKTGTGVMVGSNAFIFQKIQIGNDVTIDAMTYVREDVPDRRVVSCRRETL